MSARRIPEPALIRSVLVAVTGVVAFVLGRELDTAWIEAVLAGYGLLTPVLAGLLIRPVVTPVDRREGRP
ncbi:hypothetical protein NONI108955_36455 [Nocardia ninae]|uniref:Uncharacterized protein n=1 Tax=Nocardia ninae NBRC 108245 TaxID=1210091 RepID=A0A511MFM9_9NOCA|nr:hypothetical protein [Nocardia ninae]GEM39503.1 hypothetical protein NN4_40220 [Nocardia ninae NBRC 108245]